MRRRGVPILIVLLLIFVIGIAGVISMYVKKHTPTKKEMDKTEYFGEMSENEIPLVFETEILEDRGLLKDGVPYLPLRVVNSYLNPKYYWAADEKKIFYAHPNEVEKVPANDKSGKVLYENDQVYLSLDFVKEYTDMDTDREVKYTLEDYTSIQKDFTINLAWHQVTTKEANATLDDTLASVQGVNVISPTWYTITDNKGNIKSIASKEYVTKAHQRGMEVWGLIDNFSADISTEKVLESSSARAKIVKQLMTSAKRTGLDGINVDFESMTEEAVPHFLEFLRELSIECRERGLTLSVDNPPPQNYTKYYNRKEQASVVDYVVIMGYDEHYNGSEEAGSVASLPWVIEGVEDTLKEVPAEKIIHGIPLYTRLWKTSAGIVTSEAIEVHKVETYWNKEVHQNYGKYEEGNDVYEIWLEDADSIAEKVKLVPKYGLAGVAEWKLGFEDPGIWSVINENLSTK